MDTLVQTSKMQDIVQEISLKRKVAYVDVADIAKECKISRRTCTKRLQQDKQLECAPENPFHWRVCISLCKFHKRRVSEKQGTWYKVMEPWQLKKVIPGENGIPCLSVLESSSFQLFLNFLQWYPENPLDIGRFLSMNVTNNYTIVVNQRCFKALTPGFEILFHATSSKENVFNILHNGFDPSKISPECTYGSAFYFSPWVWLASIFGEHILICAVYKPKRETFCICTCTNKKQCIPLGYLDH